MLWVDKCQHLPDEDNIIIANEFFDAIELRQFTKNNDQILETYIDYKDNNFNFIYLPTKLKIEMDKVYENSASSLKICHIINDKINNGKGLIIDYGYFQAPNISTIQCIANNKKINIFEKPFESDITYLVNFLELAGSFSKRNINLMTQQEFLIANHIDLLALKLIKSGANAQQTSKDLQRLIANDQMGELFKVMVID